MLGLKPRILVVDDDPEIRCFLKTMLERDGYAVSLAGSGEQMWTAMRAEPPNMVLLDVGLPGGDDGITLAQRLRKNFDVGIIIVTGQGGGSTMIAGLDCGADDYVTKPFDVDVLSARVRSVLRRYCRPEQIEDEPMAGVAAFDQWRFDPQRRRLWREDGDGDVRLTEYEHALLAALVRRPNETMSRDQILALLTGRDWAPSDRSVDVLVSKLRKKIEADPSRPRFIRTARGTGYVFSSDVTWLSEAS